MQNYHGKSRGFVQHFASRNHLREHLLGIGLRNELRVY